MKNLVILLIAVMLLLGASWAQPWNRYSQSSISIVAAPQTATWTAVDMARFNGGALYQWEIICTDDDAVDFSLAQPAPGSPATPTNFITLASVTTSSANDSNNLGQVGLFDNFFVVIDKLYYKLENVSSNTCSVRLTKWDN